MDTDATTNADVEQVAPPIPTVPVTIEGVVNVREMPTLDCGFDHRELTTAAVLLLSADPLRKTATFWSDTTNIRLGNSQAGANGSSGAVWLANVPISLTSTGEVWAASTTATTTINLIVERWA